MLPFNAFALFLSHCMEDGVGRTIGMLWRGDLLLAADGRSSWRKPPPEQLEQSLFWRNCENIASLWEAETDPERKRQLRGIVGSFQHECIGTILRRRGHKLV
jgi:hypothetical protein